MTEVSSNSAPELEPSLQAFASGWSQALQSQVLLAAQSAVHSANLTEHHPPSRWLEALTRHVQIEGKVQTHKEPKDSVQAHEQEIANDLLLVSLRLLPAPPKPAHGQPEQPQPIYSAIDRLLMHNTLRILDINLNVAHEAEKAVAQQLYFVMQQAEAAAAVQQEKENSQKNKWSSSVAQSLNNSTKSWKWAATGAGFIAGGVALGLTGGLAAPLLAPLLVTASGGALAFLGTSGGVILIGSLFGLAGGGLASVRVKRRVEGIKMFAFDKLQVDEDLPDIPSLHCTIICNGIQVGMPTKPNETQPNKVQAFLSKGYKRATSRSADTASDQLASSGQSYTDQKLTASPNLPSGASTPTSASSNEPAAWKAPFRKAFESHFGMRDLFAIKIDPEDFASLGSSLQHFTRDMLVNHGVVGVLKHTALGVFMSAVALPAAVYAWSTKLLDSEWIRCLDKAKKAGPILADVLQERTQGQRPVILVGTSLGAVTILHALVELSSRLKPEEMKDIVYSATLIALPISPPRSSWEKARTVVAGPLVNAWSRNDWVLALLARAAIHSDMSTNAPAGLSAISVPGVLDVDLSDILKGHMQLAEAEVIAKVLHRTEVDERRTAPPKPDLPSHDEDVTIEGPTEEEIEAAKEAQRLEDEQLVLSRQMQQQVHT